MSIEDETMPPPISSIAPAPDATPTLGPVEAEPIQEVAAAVDDLVELSRSGMRRSIIGVYLGVLIQVVVLLFMWAQNDRGEKLIDGMRSQQIRLTEVIDKLDTTKHAAEQIAKTQEAVAEKAASEPQLSFQVQDGGAGKPSEVALVVKQPTVRPALKAPDGGKAAPAPLSEVKIPIKLPPGGLTATPAPEEAFSHTDKEP